MLERVALLLLIATLGLARVSHAESEAEQLAKELANPVANLISVPLQNNFDFRVGPDEDGFRYLLNVQPVIPIHLTEDWNLISRTILPVIYQNDIFPEAGSQFGLGDTVQSLFASPTSPMGGWIWGLGPVFLVPTATDDLLGTGQFGLGPTGVALRQTGPWTYGVLANHIWSVVGESGRRDLSATFLQPFLSYTTATAWTFTLNTETTYDWQAESEPWSVPMNGLVSKVLPVGGQLLSLGAGIRYWAESPEIGPKDFGFRLVLTFLFPTK